MAKVSMQDRSVVSIVIVSHAEGTLAHLEVSIVEHGFANHAGMLFNGRRLANLRCVQSRISISEFGMARATSNAFQAK